VDLQVLEEIVRQIYSIDNVVGLLPATIHPRIILTSTSHQSQSYGLCSAGEYTLGSASILIIVRLHNMTVVASMKPATETPSLVRSTFAFRLLLLLNSSSFTRRDDTRYVPAQNLLPDNRLNHNFIQNYQPTPSTVFITPTT
jgi:hypothetical protein